METEESYTSQSSFLDKDFLPTFGEKLAAGCRNSLPAQEAATQRAESWKPSGQRGQKRKGVRHNLGRGGYQTAFGIRINSDCNGAVNIIRKVASISLAKVGKAALALPKRYNLSSLSRFYREKNEEVAASFSPPRSNFSESPVLQSGEKSSSVRI